jgi:hypothetical protein
MSRSHGEAIQKNKHGADLNLSVEQGKHAAAIKDPGVDRSRENAAREWKGDK